MSEYFDFAVTVLFVFRTKRNNNVENSVNYNVNYCY